jgi:HK97 family phage major capsid protein
MGLNKDDQKYFDDRLRELMPEALERALESRSKGEQRSRETGVSPQDLVAQDVQQQAAAKLGGEFAMARMMRYMWNAKSDHAKASGMPVHEQIKKAGDAICAASVQRVMGGDSLSTGGAMIAPAYAEEVIPILFDMSIVRALGATSIPMPDGNYSQSAGNAAGTVQYDGESDVVTESSPTTQEISMTARRLTGMVAISNELLADSSGRSDRFIRDTLVGAVGDKEDVTFLRSDGTQNKPKGVRYFADDQSQTVNSAATATTATITDELANLEYQVMKNKIRIARGGWGFHPRTLKQLRSARDGNNNLVWGTELAGGTLNGFPFRWSTQIPITLNDVGSGSDESEVYFGNWSDMLIGDTQMMDLAFSTEATYYTGSAYVSAFAKNESVFRSVSRHDTACRYLGKEFAVGLGIRWGV